jgi:tricarballylate dehydrogenase
MTEPDSAIAIDDGIMTDATTDFDIVIIGCGVAGAAAAASAAEQAEVLGVALRIMVLERSSPDLRGGNSRWTAAYMRMSDVDTPAPGFVDDLVGNAAGHLDVSYAQRLADLAGPTLRWVASKGVQFGHLATIFLTQARPRLLPVGGGRVLLDTLLADAESRGATVVYESTACDLEPDAKGRVAAVTVRGADGQCTRASVRAVVIASGGFEGSPEMMNEHVGRDVRTVALGGQFNKGEGIRLAVALGAKTGGDFALFHAEPVDPRSDREEAVVMLYPYAVLVDLNGHRFMDEGYATIDEQYEATARRLLTLPGRRAWIIGDQRLFELPRFDDIVQTTEAPVTAATIGELAQRIGVPPAALSATIDDYNRAVEPGTFDPLRPDGKRAGAANPPKSNWARPIDRPPYVAWPQECSNVFTFGGLATDLHGRVIRAVDDSPIDGLYAAGEVTGIYYGKYTGATSVLRGLVFGREAGRHAATYVIDTTSEAFDTPAT